MHITQGSRLFLLSCDLTNITSDAQGWEAFTDAAITKVSALPHSVVFILWGKPAQLKEKLINTSRHHVLKSAHPSGLSAHRGFFGSKFGSQANALLVKSGQAPIDWQIDSVNR